MAGALALLLVPEHPGSPTNFEPATPFPRGPGSADPAERFAADSVQEPVRLAAAAPFVAHYADAQSSARALACLTEAIYYEGALEPEAGQRAIAQVVLNRVRHPAYPASVCGVVFEGQHRTTGCQFTFTCDGSRARRPVPALWDRAEQVAKAALGGRVAEEVGLATHYHADYVSPYWTATLDRAQEVGRHIYYSWRGAAGDAAAFSARYAGREPLIADYAAPTTMPTDAPDSASVPGEVPAPAAAEAPLPLPGAAARTPFKARPLRLARSEDGAP